MAATFATAREAKEFLVARIVEEAQREGVPLSEVERKMLYFTESGWTLPDIMDVSDKFDEEYDQDEYEEKIARLVKGWSERIKKENPEEYSLWWAAVQTVKKEDHFILIPIERAGVRPPGDQWKLFLTGCAVAIAAVGTPFLLDKIPGHFKNSLRRLWPAGGTLWFFLCMAVAAISAAYLLLILLFGKKKANETVSTLLGRLF